MRSSRLKAVPVTSAPHEEGADPESPSEPAAAPLCPFVAYEDPLLARGSHHSPKGNVMIILGVILLVIGLVAGIAFLWTIGVILVAIGVVLWILGAMGHAVAGRRHYW